MKRTPSELRDEFIQKAYPIIDEYINAALGTSEFKATSTDARTQVWDTIKTVILGATTLQKINAESTNNIIQMLANGDISIDQAMKLMSILEKQSNIDDLKEMKDKLDTLVSKG
jgi:hypothetical protein